MKSVSHVTLINMVVNLGTLQIFIFQIFPWFSEKGYKRESNIFFCISLHILAINYYKKKILKNNLLNFEAPQKI